MTLDEGGGRLGPDGDLSVGECFSWVSMFNAYYKLAA